MSDWPLRLLRALTRLYPLRRGRSRIANLLLKRSRSTLTVPFKPGRIELDLSQHTSRLIFLFGSSEPREIAALGRIIQEGMVAIDVGANIGEYALELGVLVGETGKVYAFEPDPRNFERLRRNIRGNALEDRVFPRQTALSDYCGEAILQLDKDGARNTIASGDCLPEPIGSVVVPCLTVDRFLAEEGRDGLDFMKIDAEGADLSILRGCRSSLLRYRPAVLAEVRADLNARFGISNCEVLEFMSALGYTWRFLAGTGRLQGRHSARQSGNVLFTPKVSAG